MKKNIAIFASGTGSNAKKIIAHFKHHPVISVNLVVSNKPDAPVLDIARENDIATCIIHREDFYKNEDILKKLNEYSIDYVVLAGFLWLVPEYLVRAFASRMVNLHPALLPRYGGRGMYGMKVHEAVRAAGETESGITIHLVNERYDEGNIIFQASCPVLPEDSPADIARKVQSLEHKWFPQIIEGWVKSERVRE